MNEWGWVIAAGMLGIFCGFRWGMKYERRRLEKFVAQKIKHGIALAMVGAYVPHDYAKEEQPSSDRKH